MKVSVVLPAYNEEKNIAQCLQHILGQTVPADEVIVVDNGSTDKTAEIAKKFNIKLITEQEKGIITARNTGYDAAQYELIARTDADTEVIPTWIERIKEFASTHDCDAIAGSAFYKGSHEKVNTQLYPQFMKVTRTLFGHYILIGPNMIIRKSAWAKIRDDVCTSEKEVHEDIDIAVHIAQMGGTICYDPDNIAWTSQRRLVRRPHSFFLEYPHRLIRMKRTHK